MAMGLESFTMRPTPQFSAPSSVRRVLSYYYTMRGRRWLNGTDGDSRGTGIECITAQDLGNMVIY